jgi:hypothetical protein
VPASTDNAGRLAVLERELIRTFEHRVSSLGVKLDHVSDPSRVMGVAGTMKIKGVKSRRRPHRLIMFVDGLPERQVDASLSSYILSLEPPAPKPSRLPSGPVNVTLTGKLEPMPALCPAWSEVYTSVAATPDGRRHPVLLSLTAAMLHSGMANESILEALVLHDRELGQKMAGRERQFVDMLLRKAGTYRPSCERARELLGSDRFCASCDFSCKPPRAAKETTLRARLVPASGKAMPAVDEPVLAQAGADSSFDVVMLDVEKSHSVDWARMLLRDEVRSFINDVRMGQAEDAPVLLVRGLPGLGKTSRAGEIVRTLVRVPKGMFPDGIDGRLRFALFVDRLARGREVLPHLTVPVTSKAVDRPVRLIYGKVAYRDGRVDREASLCHYAAKVDHLRRRGYGAGEYRFSCSTCQYRPREGSKSPSCEYPQQFDPTSSWVLSQHHLLSERFGGGADNNPHLVVLDEGVLNLVMGQRLDVSPTDIGYMLGLLEKEGVDYPFLNDILFAIVDLLALENAAEIDVRFHLGSEVDEFGVISRELLDAPALWQAVEAIEAKHDVNRLPKRFLRELLEILAEEEETGAPNSRLSVSPGDDENALTIRQPRLKGLNDRPTIVLDSTGDGPLYQQVLQRPVEVFDPGVAVEVNVTQVASAAYGKSSLRKPATRARLFKAVTAIIDGHPSEKVGVVTFKESVPHLRQHLKQHDVIFAHFWGLRGTNKLKDCQHLIVVGTPTINVEELRASVAALHWSEDLIDDTPVERWKRLGRYDDEHDVEVLVRHFVDPRLDQWLWQGREAELLQAAFRIRPLDNPTRKRIWLLTNTPVPGLEPTDIYLTLDDLLAALGVGKTETLSKAVDAQLTDAQAQGRRATDAAIADATGASARTIRRARAKRASSSRR